MTSKQLMKKAEKLLNQLNELAQQCDEQVENSPFYGTRKQHILEEACSGTSKIVRTASEELKGHLDYYCNYEEGFEWTK